MKLHEMPDNVFDFVNECIGEGYYPSYDDFINEFGDKHPDLAECMPDMRYEVESETDDEVFGLQTPDEHLRERGMSLRDFI